MGDHRLGGLVGVVDAVAPGPTETEMLSQSGLPADVVETVKEAEKARIPLGRRGEPEDVAEWIIALAAPGSSWITGQVIRVDGGHRHPAKGGGPARSW